MYIKLVQEGIFDDDRVDKAFPYDRIRKFKLSNLVLKKAFEGTLKDIQKNEPSFHPSEVFPTITAILKKRLIQDLGRWEFEQKQRSKNLTGMFRLFNLTVRNYI